MQLIDDRRQRTDGGSSQAVINRSTNRPINNTTKQVTHISALIIVAFIIFYPVLFTEYAYTDDWVELWQYKSQAGNGLISYGRYITEALNNWLYHFIDANKVHDLI